MVAPDCLDSIGELAAPILINRGSTKRFTLDLLKPSPCPYICMYSTKCKMFDGESLCMTSASVLDDFN